MRLTYLILTFIVSTFLSNNSFSQEKKYQSLLWEISGNGLEKKSYLYGTMHVSEKISYHLSSTFFEKLLNADFVATESDPTTWNDASNLYAIPMEYANSKFYTSFYSFPIEKRNLFPLFAGINYTQTNLMSRTDARLSDYQEDTYLDMFIYRTGRKYNKQCVGLENAKESMVTIYQGNVDARNVEFTFDEQALSKLQKDKSTQQLLQEYYREKDLDMLDSLMRLTTHPKILEGLLYKRNITMAKSMDSLMKLGSLFAGVGASHLPGDLGMIELLKQKGYTVSPIFSDYNDKGRNSKKEIDEYFLKPTLTSVKSADGMIELPMFEHYTEDIDRMESSDIVNGGFINVKRVSIKDYLRKDSITFNPLTLDSLFFENIPGDIIEKKTYSENGYTVFDIVSTTKTKKAEHYRYYITPLEIIAVIMGGDGEYVRKFENLVFDKIKIKEVNGAKKTIAPQRGGFEIRIPEYYKSIGDYSFNQAFRDIELQAYDKSNGGYYFLSEKTSTEQKELFDTKFELKRIAFEYLFQLDANEINSSFDQNKLAYYSKAVIGNKEINLMVTISGSKYYLLGTINTTQDETDKFFESFKFKKLITTVELYEFHDEVSNLTVEIPKHSNEYLTMNLKSKLKEWSSKDKFNIYEGDGGRYVFYNPTGEMAEVGYYNYGKYTSFESRTAFWKDFKNNITANFDSDEDTLEVKENITNKQRKEWNYNVSRWQLDMKDAQIEDKYVFINEELTEPDNEGVQILTGLVVKENSVLATRLKAILTPNSFYYIHSTVEKLNPEKSEFINHCFESISIKVSEKKYSIFDDKVDLYIDDLNSLVDSVHYSAIQSTEELVINQGNVGKIITLLETYEFLQEELYAKFELIDQVLEIDEEAGVSYLEKIYKSENVLPSTQLKVLQKLALLEDKKVYVKIQKLMEFDLPLADNKRDIYTLFNYFQLSKNSDILFPDILQYYVVPEYNKALIDFTEFAVNENKVTARKLKSYKKLLLTNAKLDYKRLKAWKNEQDLADLESYDRPYYFDYRPEAPIEDLLSYINVLKVFKNDKDVHELIEKIERLDIDEYYLDVVRNQVSKGYTIDEKIVNRLLENNETKFSMFQAMHHIDKQSLYESYEEDSIAFFAISQFNHFTSESDSLTFVKKQEDLIDGVKIRSFFYKVTDIDEDSDDIKSEKVVGIAFVLEDDKINPQSFKTFKKKTIVENKDIADYILVSLDESIFQTNRRVYHGKFNKSGGYDYFDDYYDDYYEDEYYEDEYYEEGF